MVRAFISIFYPGLGVLECFIAAMLSVEFVLLSWPKFKQKGDVQCETGVPWVT